MSRSITWLCCLAGVAWSSFAAAQERLAVLEFFGRPGGTYCEAAGPAMRSLQSQMEGRAVLLEYDVDRFTSGRLDRWWFAYSGPSNVYLPLVMVGSGYQVIQGSVAYEREYRRMLNDELARAPGAAVQAYWRRQGNQLRAYIRVENLSTTPLSVDSDPRVWLIAYEEARVAITNTWVRATASTLLGTTLEQGQAATTVIDAPGFTPLSWNQVRTLVMVEHRPGVEFTCDMLQATIATPAELQVTPTELTLSHDMPSAELELSGPHVLSWSAQADQDWLRVTPLAGSLPTHATVALDTERLPAGDHVVQVLFEASGDGLSSSVPVTLTAHGAPTLTPRRPRGRRSFAD